MYQVQTSGRWDILCINTWFCIHRQSYWRYWNWPFSAAKTCSTQTQICPECYIHKSKSDLSILVHTFDTYLLYVFCFLVRLPPPLSFLNGAMHHFSSGYAVGWPNQVGSWNCGSRIFSNLLALVISTFSYYSISSYQCLPYLLSTCCNFIALL